MCEFYLWCLHMSKQGTYVDLFESAVRVGQIDLTSFTYFFPRS